MGYDFSPVLEANNILIKDMASKLRLDKTVQAEIISLDDATYGEYRVKYEGNIFSAFSTNLNTVYKPGKSVYVTVPEGDFTQKKFITGEVSHKDISANESALLRQSIERVEPALDVFYGCTNKVCAEYGLIAGTAPMSKNVWTRETAGESAHTIADNKFLNYMKTFNKITISADFRTEFLDTQSNGNYGVAITFDAQVYEDNIPVTKQVMYKLDFNSFTGNPFQYTTWTTQSVTFNVTDNLLALHSIDFFQDGLDVDNIVSYTTDDDGVITKHTDPNTTEPNIFCTNVFVNFAEVVDYTDDLYHLLISTPDGVYLINANDTLELTGKLVCHGQDLMSGNNCQCSWYKENLSIMVGHQDYNSLAGARWQEIGNGDTLEVEYNQVLVEQKYKLICIYKEDNVLEKEITIYRYNPAYHIDIIQINSENQIKLKVQDNAHLSLSANWYQLLVDNSYSQLNESGRVPEIPINDYLLYNSITFFAEVYDGDTFICNKEFTVFNIESEQDLDVTFVETDKLYQYDVNGDITVEESELERTLYAQVSWRQGYGASYKSTWYLKVGMDDYLIGNASNKLNETTSMMKNIYADQYGVVHYHLKPKYNQNAVNNTFVLVITTPDGQSYRFEKETLFFKDGDPGTNGTSFVCVVRPVSSPIGTSDTPGLTKLAGFHALVRGGSTPMYLKAFVYKDGEEITDNTRYRIEYNWDPDGEVRSNIHTSGYPKDPHNVQYLLIDQNTLPANCIRVFANGSAEPGIDYYVKVRVRVTDTKDSTTDPVATTDYRGQTITSDSLIAGQNKESTIKTTTLTYIYPIPVFISDGDESLVEINAPQYIMYSSAGLSAKFRNVELSYLYDKVDKSALLSVTWQDPATRMITITSSNHLTALSKYVGYTNSAVTALLCSTTGDSQIDSSSTEPYLVYPIVVYLNTFGNESINGWDGTSIKVEQDAYGRGSYILAPQIGAGEKDEENKFSGVIMGLDANSNLSGLYGYSKGINTFGLRDDGSAYFGTYQGGGQIDIDGNNATIKGNPNYINSDRALILTLTNKTRSGISSDGYYTRAIEIKGKTGASPFYLTYDGKLYAKGAQIEGNITATEGKIGTWTILGNQIKSSIGSLVLDSTTGIHSTNFTLGTDGSLWCNDADISGTINASGGSIGGWQVSYNSLWNNGTLLNADGTIKTATILLGGDYQIPRFNSNTQEVEVTEDRFDLGAIGYMQGCSGYDPDTGLAITTDNFGIKTTNAQGMIFEAVKITDVEHNWVPYGGNMRMTAHGGLYLYSDSQTIIKTNGLFKVEADRVDIPGLSTYAILAD